MKKMILCLMALVACSTISAQRLVAFKGYGTNWDKAMLSSKNKPNGFMYRLREDVQCKDLPKVSAVEDKELFIAEPIDMGWLAFYRLPMAADEYDFVVVLYNHDKQPVETVNLGYVTDNHYCEVQDVRWDSDNQCILFNMACPSYAEQIDGKGSKLYSYSIKDKRIVWETDYLVSNDISSSCLTRKPASSTARFQWCTKWSIWSSRRKATLRSFSWWIITIACTNTTLLIHLHQRGRSKRVTELTHHQKAAAIWEIFFKLWCQRSNNKNNHQFVNALSSFYRYCMEKHEMIHIGQCFYMIIF